MSEHPEPFGSRLYAELRQVTGFDVLVQQFDYDAIQKLKSADREETLRMFQGSPYEVIKLLKTGEPEDVAAHLAKQPDLTPSILCTIIANL